ncbi:MAG TPA: YlxR family protein, partial [Polyangiaceae bacterium]
MLRTCVGCRAAVDAAELVRLVLSPEGDLLVDLHGGSFGRGAWVHPRPSCLAAAPSALSRALHAQVRSTPADLVALLRSAAARRIQGLLLAARRTRRLETGTAAVQAAV